MGEIKRFRKEQFAVAPKLSGNPEGKGLNGFLLDWYRSEPRAVTAKPQRQLLAEYFTSMLILSARFKYKPAIGVENFLYFVDDQWSLSLISPVQWSAERRRGFVGSCILQQDMTWTITPAELLGDDNSVADALGRFYDAFAESLDTDMTLEEILPFYAEKLPYYQRLYANALSRSIRTTVTLGGERDVPCREWQRQLPRVEMLLLPSA